MRLVILRKRQHGGLTIAGMLRHPQTNTAPYKRRSGSEAGSMERRNLEIPYGSRVEGVIAARGQSRDYQDNVPVSRGLSGSLWPRHCLAVETKVSARRLY